MKDFLKRIVSFSPEKITILLWKGPTHDETETYVVIPRKIMGAAVAALSVVLLVIFLFLLLTPLGTLLFNREDQAVREQIFEIRDRIQSLQDSLYASELQLAMFKEALAEGSDTTFVTRLPAQSFTQLYDEDSGVQLFAEGAGVAREVYGFRAEEVILSNTHFFRRGIDFPEIFPLQGSVTRTFEASNGHFGIDIAAEEGTVITAFADGIVLFSGFTVNYGNVVVLQHAEGYMSIFKHSKNLAKEKGDMVNRGDIIGFVGSDGLISSGPHLHFELWRSGIPVNPSQYFLNLN